MIGEKLGPYTILEIVGSGSMGTVYRAETPNGQLVALKLVRSQVLNTLEKREQFLRFALATSELRDQRICPILEIGDDNNHLFVIMPFIQGKTLERHLDEMPIGIVLSRPIQAKKPVEIRKWILAKLRRCRGV